MRTPMRIAAMICLGVAGLIGFDVIPVNDRTAAAQILLAVGWAAWGGALHVASSLVGDWP